MLPAGLVVSISSGPGPRRLAAPSAYSGSLSIAKVVEVSGSLRSASSRLS